MKRDIKSCIEDILESCLKIEEYTKEVSENDFYENTQIQDAVLRRLEVMGEAAKSIPQEMRDKYPQIPWKNIAGMRDVLIHTYFGVNIRRVWKVVKVDIPTVKEKELFTNLSLMDLVFRDLTKSSNSSSKGSGTC